MRTRATKRSVRLLSAAASAALLACGSHGVHAAVWTNPAGGSWSAASNWSGGIPDAAGAVADLSTLNIPGDTTVTLDGSRTVGTLLFGDTVPPFPPGTPPTAHHWFLNAGTPATSTLTLSGPSIIDVINRTAQPTSSEALIASPGAIGDAYNTFVDQTATINAVLAGNEGMAKLGYGTLVLTRANTYTGTTAVRTGTLVLDHSAAGAPASNILSSASALSLGDFSTTKSGGTLTIKGAAGATNAQSFTGTTINFGDNRILVNQNGATGVNVNLGTITRNTGGALNLALPTAGNLSAASASIPNVNGIIGGWMTVGTGDTATWAENDGNGNIRAKTTGFTEVTEAPTILSNPAANVRWSGSTGNATVNAGVTDINSLLFPDAAVRTLTIPSGSTLRMGASGGIFKSHRPAGVGQGINISQLTVGTAGSILTAGGAPDTPGELVLNSNGNPIIQEAAFMNIVSAITNNGTGAVRVVKTGNATVQLSSANSYTGGTYITEGRARAQVLGAYGTGDVHVSAGAAAYFQVAGTFSNNLFLSGKGFWEVGDFTSGTIRLNGNGTILSGTITLLSDVMIVSRGANAAGASITGKITGTGGSEFSGQAGNLGTVTLANSANDWSGNTTISGGRVIIGGAGEVIPHGPGKGDVTMLGEGYLPATIITVLDLNGKTETINGLSSTGDHAKVFIRNSAGAAATLKVGANGASGTFGGIIENGTGPVSFTKVGSGTQTLSGVNTYSGATAVEEGTLRLGADGSVPGGTNLTLGAGTTSGTLDLRGFNLSVGGLNSAGTGAANTIRNTGATPSVLTVMGGDNVFAGSIQDNTGVTLNGGSLALNGLNTYTGPTTVSAGTLIVNGSLAPTNITTLAGGTFLSGTGDGATTGKLGVVNVDAGASVRPGANGANGSLGTLTMASLNVTGGDLRFDLAPVNGDRITVTGNANFTAASTITPTSQTPGTYTLLTAGTLGTTAPTLGVPSDTRASFVLTHDTLLDKIDLTIVGTNKSLTWTGNGTPADAWNINNTANWTDGVIPEKFFNLDNVTFGDGPGNRNVTLGVVVKPGSVTVNNSTGNDYSITGAGGIGDSGFDAGTTLTKMGTGRLTLGAANTHVGPTHVQNGTVVLASPTALSPLSVLTLGHDANSATLDLSGNSATVGGLATSGTGTANIIGNSGAGPAVLTVAGGTGTFGGVIQDTLPGGSSTVGLSVTGGSLTLAGNNTYTGPTTVAPGATLRVGAGGTTGALGSGAITTNGLIVFNRSDNITVANSITGDGAMRKEGAGTLTLTADTSYTGTTTIAAGTLQLGSGGASGRIGDGNVVNNGTLAINRSDDVEMPNVISGTGGVTKNGAGQLTLTGINSYTGPTAINAGRVLVNNNASLGALPGGIVTVASGATLDISGNITINNANYGAKEFRIAGTGVNGDGAIVNNSVNQQNAFQRIVLTGDATIGGSARYDIRGGTPVLTLNNNRLTKIGGGQFTLVGATVSPGNIDINDGRFAIEAASTIAASGDTTITLNSQASNVFLQFFNTTGNIARPVVVNGDNVQIGNGSDNQNSAFASPITLNGNVTFTSFSALAGQLTANGIISEIGGPRTVTKSGPRTVVLGGVNTYTGATNIEEGILRVGGSVAQSSAVNVSSAATFEAASTQAVKELNLADTSSAIIVANGARVLDLGALNIAGTTDAWTAKVDVTNNDMIIRTAGGATRDATYARTLNQLKSGLAEASGTFWSGNGITSSTAAATGTPPGTLTAVGAILNDFAAAGLPPGPIVTAFGGRPVTANDILVKYTWFGDADLSGVVDGTDYFLIDQAFAAGSLNGGWLNGDFNYSGNVDGTDYFLIDQAFSAQTGPLSGGPPASASAVPEPSTLGVLLAAVGLLARRRR